MLVSFPNPGLTSRWGLRRQEINTVKSNKASVNVLWQSDGMLAKPV